MNGESKKGSPMWISSALMLAFVLYPLSMGPAAWLSVHAHSKTVTKTYFTVYAPIFRIWDTPIGHPFFLNVVFWSSLPPKR